MTLQAKLTLGTVLLATVIVATISAVYLGKLMDLQFAAVLRQADRASSVVVSEVREALNSHPELDFREALATSRLPEQLQTGFTSFEEIYEVAVVDEHDEILADSIPDRVGLTMPHYVHSSHWSTKPAGSKSCACSLRAMPAPIIRWRNRWRRR